MKSPAQWRGSWVDDVRALRGLSLVAHPFGTGRGAVVEKAVAAARESGLLTLTDTKGRTVIVPSDKLAYVEIGSPTIGQVGFRATP